MIPPPLAMLSWIPVSLYAFLKLRPAAASATTIVGAGLLLPASFAFDVPLLPPLDRFRLAALCAFFYFVCFHGIRQLRFRGPCSVSLLFFLVAFAGRAATVWTNQDPLQYGPLALPGLTYHDVFSAWLGDLIDCLIPFILGFSTFRSSRDLREVFLILAVAALFYSLPILYELRMSPQLHSIVYGYRQHAFGQTKRFGGWRPQVFMNHGIGLSMFLLMSAVASAALSRAGVRFHGQRFSIPAVYLAMLLVACKSLGAIVYGAVLLPAVAFAKPRAQLWLATGLATLVLLFPLLRTLDLFPTAELTTAAEKINTDRAASLQYRFSSEDQLLEKARERIALGWGSWGRSRLYELRTGEKTVRTDGYWIIRLGHDGIIGFLGFFGMILAPVVLTLGRYARIREGADRILFAALALIVAIQAVDLLPNGFFLESITIFTAGALAGSIRGLTRTAVTRRLPSGDAPPEPSAKPPPPLGGHSGRARSHLRPGEAHHSRKSPMADNF